MLDSQSLDLMKSFRLKIYCLKGSYNLDMDSHQDIDDNIFELLSVFENCVDESKKLITIDTLQKNTNKIRKNVTDFIERHKNVNPQINRLGAFMRDLDDGEYFYVLPGSEFSNLEMAKFGSHLHALNNDLNPLISERELISFIGDFLDNYEMQVFDGERRLRIGIANKSKAICRFCNKTSPSVKFKKKAHAISEALGNKGIICNEECDACNAAFGNGIETDLIAYLGFFRSIYGIKGKSSGTPKLKGKNFTVKKAETGHVEFSVLQQADGLPEKVDIYTHEKISQQNIYRSLCKYVISVIPNEHLAALDSCIEWINGNAELGELPPVYTQIVNELYSEYPSLCVYIRKNSDIEIPHIVGEFRFASFLFLFILPSSTLDSCTFTRESSLDKFWQISNQLKRGSQSKWTRLGLQSDERKELKIEVNFQQRV